MHFTRRTVSATLLACAALATGDLATAPLAHAAANGLVVTFTSGTGDGSGKITVTNASNGSTATVGLIPQLSPEACASMLSDAAPRVGFKTELAGATVTIKGRGVVVKVEGPSITKTDLP